MVKTIKPCPFCGSNATLICFNFEYGTVTVGCTNEDCDITMGKGFFSDDEAIEHWNRRVNEAEIRVKELNRFANWVYEKYNKDLTDYVEWYLSEQLKECE